MTRKEYEQKLKALEQEIAALRQEAVEDESEKPMPPHPRPKLNRGELYYYLQNHGGTYFGEWRDTEWDLGRLAIGNVFLTEEAAEYAVEYFKVLSEMREWAGKWNDPYRILYIDGRVEPETVFVGRCISYGELRFATKADAKNCIKAVGRDRLIKYYFGVRDHEADV